MSTIKQPVSTGVPGLDRLVGGGYPNGRTILVSGQPGVGKTMLGIQFVLAGLQSGEKAVYITLDQPAPQCIADAESAGLSLAPHLHNNRLKILDLTHYFNKTEAMHDDVFSATQLVDDIRRFIAKFGAQRVVMDPVSPLIFRHSRSLAVLEYLRQLIGMFESKIESTVVLIANAQSGGLDQHDTEAFATAGVIQLQHSVDVMEHQRHICVYKMRGVSIQSGCFPVTITPGVGVVVTP